MATRFMTDPHAMRDMAGRFEVHAQTVEDEARRMWASAQNISGAGWSGMAEATSLDTMTQMNQAFRNIVNMLHGVRDGLVRDANNYEQQEQASSRSSAANVSRCSTILLQAKENRFDDHQLSIRHVDDHGAMIRAQAGLLEAEHQAIIRDVLTASDFWGGAGSAACQGFITQLGRNFQVIYEQANAHGQKVQAAGNNMAQTDSAVGSSWA